MFTTVVKSKYVLNLVSLLNPYQVLERIPGLLMSLIN